MAYDSDESSGIITSYHHYPAEPGFVFDQSRNYGPQEAGPKPDGLWISVGTEWIDWCRANDWMDWQESPYYEFKFSEYSNFLVIDNEVLLLDFTKHYLAPINHFCIDHNATDKIAATLHPFYIDWEKVTNDYQGIFIMPYVWSLRLDPRTKWYYGWDVASGVVWDLSTVVEVKRWENESQGTNRGIEEV